MTRRPPLKRCPSCGKKHGVSKLKCECGFRFLNKNTGKKQTLKRKMEEVMNG